MLSTLELELNTLCDRMEHQCFNCGKTDKSLDALPLFQQIDCKCVQMGVICVSCQEKMTLRTVEQQA